jgi:hypothetical protein
MMFRKKKPVMIGGEQMFATTTEIFIKTKRD